MSTEDPPPDVISRRKAFPFEDCERWIDELGLDWDSALSKASIGKSQKYVIKNRWGANPEQMDALRARLREIELARKKRTPTGAKLLALEEWNELGQAIAALPDEFEKLLIEARRVAGAAKKIAAARKLDEEGRAALLSPFDEPTKNRK